MCAGEANPADRPILVVDEADTAVRIARNVLAQLGVAAVDEASTVRAAAEKLRRRRYRAIIAGRGALAEIEAAGLSLRTPVIANPPEDAAQLRARLAAALSTL